MGCVLRIWGSLCTFTNVVVISLSYEIHVKFGEATWNQLLLVLLCALLEVAEHRFKVRVSTLLCYPLLGIVQLV